MDGREPESQVEFEIMICPYCGEKHHEGKSVLWELPNEGTFECEECGRTMAFTKEYTTIYYSYPIKGESEKEAEPCTE